jgi:dihydroflavonol-4-reductase
MEANGEARVNVLVTGGTGFFGHNLIKLLLADPRIGKINVYARHPPPTERKLSALVAERIITAVGQCDGYASDVLHKDCVGQSDDENAIFGSFDAKNRIQLFYGDIARNESILIQAMTGCSIVFHACGDTRWWNAINSSQYMTNVIGTTMVLNRAADLGVKRVIHTSTVDVMGHGPGVINEDYWKEYSFADFGYNYADTKRDAELSISLFNNSRGPIGLLGRSVALPEVVIIRPGSMLGAWDVTDKYGRLFKEIKEKSLAGIPSGGTSVCHVEDVAKAHIAAAFLPSETLDKSGRVFICAGDNMTYRELFHAMRRMLKMDSNGKTIGFLGPCGCEVIPRPILVAYGWLCELWSTHVSKKEPEINPGMARYMSCNAFYDSSLAVKYLGYAGEGRSAQAIADSHEWYRVRGRI